MALEPYDAFNATLLRNVAPSAWVTPTPKRRYHLVVFGAGTAGLVSAAVASILGARVALVERHMFGGDCLNFGCVPSKALLSAARAWHAARTAAERFGGPVVSARGDFGRVMARLRALRAHISNTDGVERFQKLGIDIFFGQARFAGVDTIAVGDVTLRFRRAMIATGGRALRPDISGLADTPYDTNESIFSLTELPRRLMVIGGGPVGTELAQAFARFGSAVTLACAGERLLVREDEDASTIVERSLASDGVRIVTAALITRAHHDGVEFHVEVAADGTAETVVADRLLIAAGRSPNVEGLGLEAAGVACTPKGITINDRFRTSNPRIFAIGDVVSPRHYTHLADAQARLAVANALFFGIGGGRNRRLVVPRATYTSPEVAHVGLTVSEAEARGECVETMRVELAHNDRAILDSEDTGFLKVHLRRGTDRILGATLVAEHAGDMIGELAVAITNRVGLGAIGKTIHPYPTQSEVFRKAADLWRLGRLTPTVKRAFSWWFRVFA